MQLEQGKRFDSRVESTKRILVFGPIAAAERRTLEVDPCGFGFGSLKATIFFAS